MISPDQNEYSYPFSEEPRVERIPRRAMGKPLSPSHVKELTDDWRVLSRRDPIPQDLVEGLPQEVVKDMRMQAKRPGLYNSLAVLPDGRRAPMIYSFPHRGKRGF